MAGKSTTTKYFSDEFIFSIPLLVTSIWYRNELFSIINK
jgi:hypothetical protein